MSLSTDSIFITALQSNTDLLAALTKYTDKEGREYDGGTPRLYGVAIPLPDEDADNVPVPYAIVTFDGLTNGQGTKDNRYEDSEDKVQIGVEIAARTLDQLHTITQMVRDTILTYLRTTPTAINDYQLTAGAIQFDSMKPCYWQVLSYACDVDNTYDDEQAEE